MADSSRGGPALDAQAAQAIVAEDERHRQRLLEIERDDSGRWAELLVEENDLHLKLLKEVYSELAERRLREGREENGTVSVE